MRKYHFWWCSTVTACCHHGKIACCCQGKQSESSVAGTQKDTDSVFLEVPDFQCPENTLKQVLGGGYMSLRYLAKEYWQTIEITYDKSSYIFNSNVLPNCISKWNNKLWTFFFVWLKLQIEGQRNSQQHFFLTLTQTSIVYIVLNHLNLSWCKGQPNTNCFRTEPHSNTKHQSY